MSKSIRKKRVINKLRRKKIIIVTSVLLTIGILISVVFTLFIRNYINEMVGQSVIELIENRSGGQYKIAYDSIELDIKTSTLHLKDFSFAKLENDTTNFDKLISVEVINAELTVNSFWQIVFLDKLVIEKASFIKPKIDLVTIQENQTKVMSSKILLETLRSQLDIFKIGEFEIENARIEYSQKKKASDTPQLLLDIYDISMKITGLQWDTDESIDQIKSGEFYISIKEQDFIISDSTLRFSFEKMWYSIEKDSLTISKSLISSYEKKAILLEKGKPFVDLVVPQFSITGFNLITAYQEEKLVIDSLYINKADLYLEGANIQNKNKNSDFLTTLNGSLSPVFNIMEIKSFISKDAKIKILRNNLDQNLKIEEFDIKLRDVTLKTNSKNPNEKAIFDINHALIQIEDISLISDDSLSNFYVKTALFDKTKKDLLLDSVIIKASDHRSFNEIDLILGQLKIEKIDIDAFLDKKLVMDKILLKGINLSGSLKDMESGENPAAIDEKISDVLLKSFDQISVNKIELDSAVYNLKTPDLSLESENFNFWVSNFNISKNDRSFLNEINFRSFISNINLYSKADGWETQVSNLNFNFNENLLDFSSIQGKFKQGDVSLKDISLEFEDMLTLIENKKIVIKSIEIADYRLKLNGGFENNNSSKKNPDISIKALKALKGQVSVSSDKQELNSTVNNLYITDLNSNGFTLLKDYQFQLLDLSFKNENTTVSAKSSFISSNNKIIRLKEFSMNSQNDLQAIALAAKEASFENFHENLFTSNPDKLVQGSLNINDWTLSVDHEKKSDKINASKKANSSYMPKLILDEINLKNGSITNQSINNLMKIDNIDLTLSETIFLDSGNFYQFPAKIEGCISEASFTDDINTIKIDKVNFSNGNSLLITNLSVTDIADKNRGTIDSVKISSLIYQELIMNNNFQANAFEITNPELKLTLKENNKSEKSPMSFNIDRVSVKEAILNLTTAEGQNLKVNPLDMELVKFNYDSTFSFSNRLFPSEQIFLSTRDLEFISGDSLNKINIDQISLTNNKNKVSLKGIKISSPYDDDTYMQKSEFETDKITGEIQSVNFYGLKFRDLLERQAIIANYITVDSPEIRVYRDKNNEDPPFTYKSLPISALMDVKYPVIVDSLGLRNGNVTYEERAQGSSYPGYIKFNSMNATAINITNDSLLIAKNSVMRINCFAKINNEVNIDVKFKFHLDSKIDAFEFSGNVEPNDLTVFNTMSEHNAFVKVKSGRCKGLNFTAYANNELGYGSMYFKYNNLKVALVDKQKETTKSLDEEVASFFANTFIVKKRNQVVPRLRKGDIFFERLQNKSVFNYFNKLLSSGLMSSIGLKNYKKEAKKAALANMDK